MNNVPDGSILCLLHDRQCDVCFKRYLIIHLQIADDLYLVLDVGMTYVQGCEHLCGSCMKQSDMLKK